MRSFPCPHNGQTFSFSAETICAFCSTGRPRKVEPVTVQVLALDRAEIGLDLGAGYQRDKTQPPVARQQVELARDVVAADHIEDRIDLAALGELLATFTKSSVL